MQLRVQAVCGSVQSDCRQSAGRVQRNQSAGRVQRHRSAGRVQAGGSRSTVTELLPIQCIRTPLCTAWIEMAALFSSVHTRCASSFRLVKTPR